jgi:uncharacterized metal-binding protein YceD (DUF177 family)
MKNNKDLVVRFGGLKEGIYNYSFKIDKTFFNNFDVDYINEAEIKIDLEVDKRTTFMIFDFNIDGEIKTDCDRCNDELKLEIVSERKIYIKFAEDFGEESDEILLIPHSEVEFDLNQLFYEFLTLEIPIKKTHEIEDCNQEVIKKLSELRPDTSTLKKEESIDPRWNALKNLN